jgi:serine/threonine-protein kinase
MSDADAPRPPATPPQGVEQVPARPPATHDPLIGITLAGRYEILRRIGEGGMGAVYEGRHTVLGKRVAVKVLLEKFLEKTELVARLLQEARLASAIGHENIVDVTDFGTTSDGRSFVVMEFLDGESLAEVVMRDAPLPLERCLRLGRQVTSALGAAHDKGIVHRDVKPENVFLMRRGEQDFVKVVDFGVSKAVRTRDEGADLLRLTRTGMVLGTPLYMSPEQARGGEDVDARADVWAVGVMLYECLTGEVPFRANNYLGVISQVLTQEVQPPSQLRPELGIPVAVEAVVMRAMAKDREQRYQRMADLERDLERLLAGDPNVGLPVSAQEAAPAPRRAGARWHLGIAAVLLLGLGVALALARTEEESRAAARTPPAAAKVVAPAAAPRPAPPPPPPPEVEIAPPPASAAAIGEATSPSASAAPVVESGPPPAPPASAPGANTGRKSTPAARPTLKARGDNSEGAAPPPSRGAGDDELVDPATAFPKKK